MLMLLNLISMTHNLFLFSLFALLCVSHSNIVQNPAVVKVFRGETVSLTCDTQEVMYKCDTMFWFKVDQRTGDMILSGAVHTDKEENLCRGFIYNTSTADSGTYYCSIKHSFIAYTGNGSTVIITERSPRPHITVYVPNVIVGPSVSMLCVVMGVVPSEVSISWIIGDSEMTGWTESGWTHTSASAVEYTRAHISVPSEKWTEAQNAECVVEVDGRRFSKSVKAGSSQFCLWLMFLCSGVALVVIAVFSITFAALHSAGQHCMPTRSPEARFSQRNGGKRKTEKFSTMEVQYASLDLINNRHQGSNTLNRNIVFNEIVSEVSM